METKWYEKSFVSQKLFTKILVFLISLVIVTLVNTYLIGGLINFSSEGMEMLYFIVSQFIIGAVLTILLFIFG